jgi:hypothetical protein
MPDSDSEYPEIEPLLSDGEEVLDTVSWSPLLLLFTSRSCYLTRRRVIRMDKTAGAKFFHDVPLQSIDTITQDRSIRWRLLIVGIILLGFSLVITLVADKIGWLLVTISALAIIYAIVTRNAQFTLCTVSKNLHMPSSGRGKHVEEFVMNVRTAWNKRNQW